MSYSRIADSYSLTVTDKEGLEDFLKQELHDKLPELLRVFKGVNLSVLLSVYWEDVLVHEDGKIVANRSFDCWHNSNDEPLTKIAPFIKGYIRWRGEDGDSIEEVFNDGKQTIVHPIWPSDYFYIECWSDEDLRGRIPEEKWDEAKKRIREAFGDLSYRNEIIDKIAEELKGGCDEALC